MGDKTHISGRFEWWSVADCSCEYCLYRGKKQTCLNDSCAIEDIRQETLWREQAAACSGAEDGGAASCLG